ncbi:hypothetical protein L1887_55070 [Cichorium endivia]|nr:hypothetical protein L1887_55070 [Cichorium endivia]
MIANSHALLNDTSAGDEQIGTVASQVAWLTPPSSRFFKMCIDDQNSEFVTYAVARSSLRSKGVLSYESWLMGATSAQGASHESRHARTGMRVARHEGRAIWRSAHDCALGKQPHSIAKHSASRRPPHPPRLGGIAH